MIDIKKKPEPAELLKYRKSKDASFDSMPREVKEAVRESLLKEQGHLCAYCMRRIPQKDVRPGIPPVSIEHWASQKRNDDKTGLDYRNMLAVCSGNRGCGCEKDLTCDARRGSMDADRESTPLTVNPTIPATLIGIGYHNDGRIYSTNSTIDTDLNDILNLNCQRVLLPDTRLDVLRSMQKQIIKRQSSQGDRRSLYEKYLNKYLSETDPRTGYVGILIWWLKRQLKIC